MTSRSPRRPPRGLVHAVVLPLLVVVLLGLVLAVVLMLASCGDSGGDNGNHTNTNSNADPCAAAPPCGGHGTCDATDAAGDVCACDPGYEGDACDGCARLFVPQPDGTCRASVPCEGEDTCGLHATCDDTTGIADCVCDPGYIGDYCDDCDEGYTPAAGGECEPVSP